MIAERVPGELAHEPMILMEVVAGVREHEVRADLRLQVLEEVLHVAAHVREVSVSELMDPDVARAAACEECLGAPARLSARARQTPPARPK